MKKRICLITGCSGGIGKDTAKKLAQLDYHIIMLVRKGEKSLNAYQEVLSASTIQNVKMFYTDLSSQNSIKKVVEEIKKEYDHIDLLINNAGVIKRKLDYSEEGIEMTLAVNYFAPFLLANLLVPLLKSSSKARVINLSSELYKKGEPILETDYTAKKFDGNKAYANSKLLINLFTYELSKRLNEDGITVNCLHPGVIGTDAFREYPKIFSKMLNLFLSKPEEGANNVVYLSTSNEFDKITGKYFNKTTENLVKIINDELSEKVWNETEEILKI